jgi:flagellar biosynthetic protein FlhB
VSGEKTEKPTPQKKQKARREGQIGKSPDVGAWVGMLAASFLLPLTISLCGERVRELVKRVPEVIADPDPAEALSTLSHGLLGAAIAVAPLALTLMLLGIAAGAGQGGLHFATKLLVPKFNRLNPFSGIKRVFGPKAWWEGVKALVKTVVLGAVLYSAVRGLFPVLLGAGGLPLNTLLGAIGDAVLSLVRSAAAAGLAMAALDFIVVRRRTNKQLRMTKQEVKEEHKRSEGDPHVKGAIRSRQMAMSRNRMMSKIAQADVVLVNPTHVAVALQYRPERGAPRVVAKGSGHVATRIREEAAKHRVPMVADIPLARALHASCEIGTEVPPELYGAVARVLAFVLGLKARGSAAGTHRVPVAASRAA